MFLRKKTSLKDFSDEKLIALYKESERNEYVGELFERYTRPMFFVCMKYLKDETEAQDAVMHVFEKLLRDLLTYEVQSFKYWVHTVVRNHCFALIASHKRSTEKAEIYHQDVQDLMETEENLPLFAEGEATEAMLSHLPAAIASLNVEQRTCIELFYLNGKSYVEISEETGYAMTKVKSYIQNGKRNLKIYLEKNIVEIILLILWLRQTS